MRSVFALVAGLPMFSSSLIQAHQVPLASPKTPRRVIPHELYQSIERVLQDNTIPGYAVAIIQPNVSEEDEFATWGKSTENGDPVTPDTLFSLASVSKAFTATAIGILMDDFTQGTNVTALPGALTEFNWKTKIQDILPEDWALADKWAQEKASVHDLLSHVTGLPSHDYSYHLNDTPLDVIHRMRYLRPTYELRERWQYNNQPYMLASHVVAVYSGMPYHQFLTRRIFEPLNMYSSTCQPEVADKTGRRSQSWNSRGRRIPNWYNSDIAELIAGLGGVISSARDMAQWARVLLGTRQGVNPRVLEDVMRPHVSTPPPPSGVPPLEGYGMGWLQAYYSDRYIVWHDGGMPGVSTLITVFPQDDLVIVQLANADEKARVNTDIMHLIAREALHLISDEVEGDADKSSGHPIEMPLNTTLPLTAYTGTYHDPGYGNITLCALESTSSECKAVLRDFAIVDGTPPRSGVPPAENSLFAAWDRTWDRQHRFAPRGAKDQFRLMSTNLYPNGFGDDTSPFETPPQGSIARDAGWIEFEVEGNAVSGFGLFGQARDPEVVEREQKAKGSVKDSAEAWFTRIG